MISTNHNTVQLPIVCSGACARVHLHFHACDTIQYPPAPYGWAFNHQITYVLTYLPNMLLLQVQQEPIKASLLSKVDCYEKEYFLVDVC